MSGNGSRLDSFHTELLIYLLFLLTCCCWTKPVRRMCADPEAIDLLGLSLSSTGTFPRGVEIVTDGGRKGYKFAPESITTGMPASTVLNKCKYFPTEFSFVISFKSSTQRLDSEYLMTLLGPDRETILMAIRTKKDSLYFDFLDKNQPKRQTIGIKSSILSDGSWHDVIIAVSNTDVTFTIDCGTPFTRSLKAPFPERLDTQNGHFYIASRRKKRNRFTGILRQLKLLAGSDASYYLCSTSPSKSSNYPGWIDNTVSKDPKNKVIEFEEGNSRPQTCDTNNKGHFVYRPSTGQLEMCEGTRWKRLAIGNIAEERLDYIEDFLNLKTKSKTLDFEVFRIPSEGQFLAAANQGRDRDMDSTIYKWTNGKFIPYQNITTDSAQDWEYFQIGDDHFLACANQGADERSPYATSTVYRWSSSKKKFIPHQYFRTFAAQSWESFEIEGKHYLAVANFGGSQNPDVSGSSLRIKSWLYEWNPDHRAFIQYQALNTIGGVDFEYFEVSGRHYLAVANSYDGDDSRLHSVVYRWEYSKFVPLQYLETVGAQDWEHFEINGKHFLAVANYYDYRKKSYTINSTIYQLSESGNRFDKIQDIQTTGALDWEFFTVGRDSFIVAASSSDNNAKLDNIIYRWQGMEHFVPVHSISVSPSSDWEVFKTENGRQFLISANVKGKNSKILELITY
uniref:thrombospondin-type laminin G domain and EAR repeat-containing protein-like isoform X1 n=1 Tax=Styela clava TaxID=7725 RepID=UPI00193A98F6|nr:thrombospondin-type laminin G domain and EAR repeat-containing protein-like isoform X1 [Styela clava]